MADTNPEVRLETDKETSEGGALHGRVALVTGAGRGIGRAIARRLLEADARVAALDMDEAALHDAADEYGALGELMAVAADVGHESAIAGAVSAVIQTWNGLDILVNNAAIAHPRNAPVEELDVRDWQRVLDVNLTGPMLLCKHASPHLRVRRGAIINIASTRALQSEPHTEAYAASKGGLVALTHALAISLGPDVRVNCISPGWIDTGPWLPRPERQRTSLSERDHAQHPVGRVGRPEDVADLCAWLASDAAGFMTGQNLVLDGGMTRKMIYVE